jgi:hypothetical protein
MAKYQGKIPLIELESRSIGDRNCYRKKGL